MKAMIDVTDHTTIMDIYRAVALLLGWGTRLFAFIARVLILGNERIIILQKAMRISHHPHLVKHISARTMSQ